MGNACTQKMKIEPIPHQEEFNPFNSPKVFPFFQSQKPDSCSSSDDLSQFKEILTKKTSHPNQDHILPKSPENINSPKKLTKRLETNSDVIDYKKKHSKNAKKSILNVSLSLSNEMDHHEISFTQESLDLNLKEIKSASNLPSLKKEKPVFGEYQKRKTVVTNS